jgi:hypothetical protein
MLNLHGGVLGWPRKLFGRVRESIRGFALDRLRFRARAMRME